MTNWMIYGAYGYSGRLVAERALKRGHRPLLAGRSPDKLAAVANRLGLPYKAFPLDDLDMVTDALRDIDLVFHAAGPFIHTSNPMLRACLLTGTHYVDITGEYPVFENTFTYDEAARHAGVAFISGVGFDVVPSDCLASYVAAALPDATELEIAISSLTSMSAGTAKSGVALVADGGRVRRKGSLTPYPVGLGIKQVRFPHGEFSIMPIPWGDLATAYRSTGIPNITTYMVMSPLLAGVARVTAPLGQVALSAPLARRALGALLDAVMNGPTEKQRTTGRAYVWARAARADGTSREAWLACAEPYRFTALAGVHVVERLLARPLSGALTPAQAFGADFVLEIDGSERYDTLP